MSEHVPADRALSIAALDEGDTEKVLARSHAAACSDCERLIREGERMVSLLERSEPPVTVTAELSERVRRAVFAPAPAVAPARAAEPTPAAEPPHARWQPWTWAAGAALSALLIWLDVRPGELAHAGNGIGCLLFENGYALATCAGAALWARTRGRQIDPWTGSVVGLAGALVGQLFLRTHCQAAHAALHLLTFHLVGVALGTALGALSVPLLTRPR
jgi:hypothetical protein